MSISSETLVKFHTRRRVRSYEKGNLKRENEFLLTVAQNNAIRTNYFKAKIDNT